jgi:nicotinate-nucleotide adenylyltransferase
MAQAAADQLGLPEVRWIVSGRAVHKTTVATAADRLSMTRLALSDLGDHRMVVDDREVSASGRGEETPSYKTVQSLQLEFPGRPLVWLLGEDQLLSFTEWREWQWLVGQMTLAVCGRPDPVNESAQTWGHLRQAGARIVPVSFAADAISSTWIRGRVVQGLPIAFAVGESVARYIYAHQIYSNSLASPEVPPEN